MSVPPRAFLHMVHNTWFVWCTLETVLYAWGCCVHCALISEGGSIEILHLEMVAVSNNIYLLLCFWSFCSLVAIQNVCDCMYTLAAKHFKSHCSCCFLSVCHCSGVNVDWILCTYVCKQPLCFSGRCSLVSKVWLLGRYKLKSTYLVWCSCISEIARMKLLGSDNYEHV